MKRLGIFRHAKSDWDDVSKRDFDRGLNERGQRGAALMGRHITDWSRRHDIDWDILLASPAERVQRTLESAGLELEPQWNRALYLAGVESIIDVIRDAAGSASSVLVMGHNPGLQDLFLELVDPARENALFDEAKVKFPTAAFAVLEIAIDDWADLGGEDAEVVHFKRPRDLDSELGPQH